MNKKVIDLLNQARSRELLAISQYMVHHYKLEDKDFGKLASKLKEIAIVEDEACRKTGRQGLILKRGTDHKARGRGDQGPRDPGPAEDQYQSRDGCRPVV